MTKNLPKEPLASTFALIGLVTGMICGIVAYAGISWAQDAQNPYNDESSYYATEEELRALEEQIEHSDVSESEQSEKSEEVPMESLRGSQPTTDTTTLQRTPVQAPIIRKALPPILRIPPSAAGIDDHSFVGERRQFGCFTPEKEWTMDRSSCDWNQSRHFMEESDDTTAAIHGAPSAEENAFPSVPIHEELHLQERMHKKFLHETARRHRQEELRMTIVEAIKRMEKIRGDGELPEDIILYMDEMIGWLKRIEADQAIDDTSPDEVVAAAKEVGASTKEVFEVLKESGWREPAEAEKRRGIETISGKIQTILSKMPQVIGYFETAPEGSEAAYQKARASFDEVKAACDADLNTCKNFSSTLDALEELKTIIDSAITVSGNTLLRERIDALMKSE